jgi:hypothetical protein
MFCSTYACTTPEELNNHPGKSCSLRHLYHPLFKHIVKREDPLLLIVSFVCHHLSWVHLV